MLMFVPYPYVYLLARAAFIKTVAPTALFFLPARWANTRPGRPSGASSLAKWRPAIAGRGDFWH